MLDKFNVQNYHLKGLVHEFKYVDKDRQTLVKIPFFNLLDSLLNNFHIGEKIILIGGFLQYTNRLSKSLFYNMFSMNPLV
jgi:hypothetical protein